MGMSLINASWVRSQSDQPQEGNEFCITSNGVRRTRRRLLNRTEVFRRPWPRQGSGHMLSCPPRFYAAKKVRRGVYADPSNQCWTKPLRGRLQEESIAY